MQALKEVERTDMDMQYVIRLAAPIDYQAIVTCQRAAIATVPSGYYPPQTLSAWWRAPAGGLFDLILARRYYVVEREGMIVAGGGWESSPGSPETATVRSVFVHPAHIKHGLGRAIVDAAEDAAVTRGFTRFVAPAAYNATGFYQRLGYAAADLAMEIVDGQRLGYCRMWKQAA